MIKNSKNTEYLLEAINRGYYVLKDGTLMNPKGKKLKGHLSNKGYYNFNFRFNNKHVKVLVHQLQAYQKYKDLIFEYECIRHLNGNSCDNSWNNILLGSSSDNMLDKDIEQRKLQAKKASKETHSFSKKEVLSIWNDRQKGLTYKDLCIKYNTNKGTLSNFFNKAQYVKEILIEEKLI